MWMVKTKETRSSCIFLPVQSTTVTDSSAAARVERTTLTSSCAATRDLRGPKRHGADPSLIVAARRPLMAIDAHCWRLAPASALECGVDVNAEPDLAVPGGVFVVGRERLIAEAVEAKRKTV